MIRPAGLVMAVVMVGVAAGTYYGLDYVPPGLMPKAIRRAEPPAAPQLGGETGVAPAAPAPTEPVDVAQAPPAEEPMTEQDLAEEPPPEPASSAPAAEPEPAPATEPAAPAPQAAAKGEPAEKPEPGWGEPAEDKPAAAPKPAAPKAAKPAPKPAESASAPSAQSAAPAASAPATKPKPPEADAIKPWWPDPAKMPADQLKLQYAGQVQGQHAIALLFSAPVSVDTLKAHAKIRTMDGKDVGGRWELGKNPRLAVFRGVKAGRYTVILGPGIADAKGFMLGTTLQGPVYIQGP